MSKMNYYGALTNEVSERERAHAGLARRAAAEGFVLLQNDGTLPLQTRKVALYGMGARKTIAGGEGSGDVAPRYKVSIEQGLENAGYEITSKSWLDDYDEEYAATYEEYRVMVEEKIADIKNPVAQIPVAHSYKYRYPSGRLIQEKDVSESDTDTAVYVLMRQAGECADRRNVPGDFQLTEIEIANLRFISENYASVVLVINVGGMVDLSVLDEVQTGAVVFFVQGGMEGGNALADLLSGAENFSGKLADSWPKCYEDIPGGESFSSLNGNLEEEHYTEGLYVGYRYYDSFGAEPRWPFGYGLSYTDFDVKTTSVTLDKTIVTVDAEVTNTGSTAGREVVQLYMHVPGDVAQSLCAFCKTEKLAPGETATVQISFRLEDMAVWCDECAAWILPEGTYSLMAGNSSRNIETAAIFVLDETVKTKICKSCCAPEKPVEEIQPEQTSRDILEEMPCIRIDPAVFKEERTDYIVREVAESAWVKEILDLLTPEEQIELVRGGDLQSHDSKQHQIMGAGGKTCITLQEKGVPNILFSDGPAGINIMEEVVYGEDGSQKTARMPEKYNWGLMRKMSKQFIAAEGQHVYRYATAWPVEELLAQTWDTELVEEIGRAVGEEMKEFGITLWLAPGMNIHRNPLCGRTFEYYSEDPLLTGKMASALTKGVQSHKGLGVTVKHFCCNNQEDNRVAVSSHVSEKALRQIYLKGFEIAVKESKPLAVMSSYNKLNGTYTGMRKDLIEDILRSEWGFEGLVMSDWGTRYDPVEALHATTDLIMPGGEEDKKALTEALKEGLLDTAALRRSAGRVLRLIENGITGK